LTIDPFTQRTLTITAPVALLDVTPQALGSFPRRVRSDPTNDPTINASSVTRPGSPRVGEIHADGAYAHGRVLQPRPAVRRHQGDEAL